MLSKQSSPAAELAVKAADAAAKGAEAAAQQAQDKLQVTLGQLTEREAGVPVDLADPKALQAARDAAEKTRDAYVEGTGNGDPPRTRPPRRRRNQNAGEASDQTRARLAGQQKEKTADLDQRLKAAGFADADAYRTARLVDAEIAALDGRIRGFEASSSRRVNE